ncbi:hypothetical protein Trydic_g23339 [Trypoxylus dichotomus]
MERIRQMSGESGFSFREIANPPPCAVIGHELGSPKKAEDPRRTNEIMKVVLTIISDNLSSNPCVTIPSPTPTATFEVVWVANALKRIMRVRLRPEKRRDFQFSAERCVSYGMGCYSIWEQISVIMRATSPVEVFNLIRSLKDTKSVGHDEIPTKLIKACSHHITHLLVYSINLWYEKENFPDELKISTIKLICNGGEKSKIDNVRPIYILERILHDRIYSFIEEINLISFMQNGYVKKRGTSRAIHQTMCDIFASMNQDETTIGIFTDLTKAFDGVCWNKLQKLELWGINRYQRMQSIDVRTGQHIYSDWLTTM